MLSRVDNIIYILARTNNSKHETVPGGFSPLTKYKSFNPPEPEDSPVSPEIASVFNKENLGSLVRCFFFSVA